jgi:hypothetical protein
MNDIQLEQLTSATLLALGRVDLSRREQIQILELALERLRVTEEVDQEALLQLVGGKR